MEENVTLKDWEFEYFEQFNVLITYSFLLPVGYSYTISLSDYNKYNNKLTRLFYQ